MQLMVNVKHGEVPAVWQQDSLLLASRVMLDLRLCKADVLISKLSQTMLHPRERGPLTLEQIVPCLVN